MKFGEFIRKALEEAPGVPSSTRLQLLIVTVAVVLVLLGLSIGVAFGTIADIPAGVVTFGSLVFGGAATAKVVQQRKE